MSKEGNGCSVQRLCEIGKDLRKRKISPVAQETQLIFKKQGIGKEQSSSSY